MQYMYVFRLKMGILRAGLSQCSFVGPRAVVFGQVFHFWQILFALENC